MFNDVRQVYELELLLFVTEELSDVAGDVEKSHAIRRPSPNIVLVGDAEIGTVNFLVTQLQACGDKPPVTNPKLENWRRSILGQIRLYWWTTCRTIGLFSISCHVARAIPAA